MNARLFLCFCAIFSLGLLSILAMPNSARAQQTEFNLDVSLLQLWRAYNPEYALPAGTDIEQAIREYKGPVEPTVPKIEFYKYDRPEHLQGRIESLLHGIKITLPPEYDHYGYEIRRYMKSVGNISIYQNRYAIETAIVDVEKAWVVFRYWREALLAEIEQLEVDLQKDPNASSKVKTLYNVNKIIVTAFIVEMQSWINSNDDLLKFLADNRKFYTFEQGRFLFKRREHAKRLVALFAAREKAKREMRKYFPFGAIVY